MIMKSTGPNAKKNFLRYFQPEIKFLLTNTWLQFSISVQLFKNFILLLLMLSLSNIKNCWLMTWGWMTWNMQVFQISKKNKKSEIRKGENIFLQHFINQVPDYI